MADKSNRRGSFAALFSAMVAAMQWRLLLLWVVLLLLPTLVVALPLWHVLGGLTDYSVHASAWSQHFNGLMFEAVFSEFRVHGAWLGGTAWGAILFVLLLTPFMDGMVVGSGRARRAQGFVGLLQSGMAEYGRMFRVMLWSLLPYLLVLGVFIAGSKIADDHGEHAVLEAQADAASNLAHWALLATFILAQAIVESTRAAFIADPDLRSATRALGRGLRQLWRRPLATLWFYLAVSAVGLVIAGAFGVLRIHVTAVGVWGFLLAFGVSQLMVLTMGWMRAARLFALAKLAP